MKNQFRFSVLTPTFNREHTLRRVFESLSAQTFRDFEWIIIDDGSTDGTKQLIQHFSRMADFPITYYYQPNGGKHRAMNNGFIKSNGELVLVFDSDDWCVPYALDRFDQIWKNIPASKRDKYSGISALKIDKNHETVGEKYPEKPELKTYLDRFNRKIRGDKWELIRRDICCKYLYPEIAGEKYLAPSYQWLLIGQRYRTLFINEKLSIIEYLTDGISKNSIAFRSKNPKGACMVYELRFKVARNLFLKFRSAILSHRFFFHGGSFRNHGFYTVVGLVPAFLLYLCDLIRLKYGLELTRFIHRYPSP